MENQHKTGHWKSLAELLGAASQGPEQEQVGDESAGQASAPAAEPIPLPKPPAAQLPPPPKQATVRQAKADWEALASVLGLSSKPVSSAPPEDSTPRSRVESSPPPQFESEPVELAAAHWDVPMPPSTEAIDPLEMSTEPFIEDVVDAVELEMVVDSEIEMESDSETSDPAADERRRRRRRRRRRGRRPEESESRTEHAASPVAEGSEDMDRGDHDEDHPDDHPDDQPAETSRAAESDDESGRPRRRRRRRRRSSGRREGGEGATAPVKSAPEEDDDSGDDEESLADLLRDDDSDEERGDEPQLSHKKIPSWQEAIEVVVTANMAQRAKHPSSGQRGRGGRR